MRKIIILLIVIISIQTISFGYSRNFEYMIGAMNIEPKTENGYMLNEEIYDKYKQFVYGSPLAVTSGQRWKNVEQGRWTKCGGAWKGSGTRGEYWILGYNLSNEFVHNHRFPVDVEPPTPPTEWRYVELSDAEKSWDNIELYLHEEQKIYMQTTKLMRDDIIYELTAQDIGLNKARVENYATWRTEGNIYTRRYDRNNKEWAANFLVPPMAANAELKAELYLENGNEYTIKKDEESIVIPITYGCQVVNLTDFAKPKHVKKIHAELTLDNKIFSETSDEKTTQISKEYNLIINKQDFRGQSDVEIEVACNSLLLTEFIVDGALTDINVQKIYIHIESNEEEADDLKVKEENRNYVDEAVPPRINSVTLGRYENAKIIPLKKSKKTKTEFICAGHMLAIEVDTSNTDYITLEFEGDSSIITLDDLTKRFEWDEPQERKVKTRYSSLKALKNTYKKRTKIYPKQDGYFVYYYVIPYKTKQTLHSWNTLREQKNDAFEIEENKLFSRIGKPYNIVIKAYSKDGVRTKKVQLDVFERWDTLYNRNLTPYITK